MFGILLFHQDDGKSVCRCFVTSWLYSNQTLLAYTPPEPFPDRSLGHYDNLSDLVSRAYKAIQFSGFGVNENSVMAASRNVYRELAGKKEATACSDYQVFITNFFTLQLTKIQLAAVWLLIG